MATWATPADVAAVTGHTPTEADVAQAAAIVETVLGRTYRPEDADDADGTWLTRAVCYQTAYMAQHPEVFTIMEATEITQGTSGGAGHSAKFGQPLAYYLAPLARRALANLRRGGTTTIQLGSQFSQHTDHIGWTDHQL